jgi:hypothetical protein
LEEDHPMTIPSKFGSNWSRWAITGSWEPLVIPPLDESQGYIGILMFVRPSIRSSHFWFPDNNLSTTRPNIFKLS